MGTIRPLVIAQNDGSSANSQEIPASTDNEHPEGTEYQSFEEECPYEVFPKFKPI